MLEPAIKVRGISKQYQLGVVDRYKTFREALIDVAAMPIRRWKRLAGLAHHSERFWALRDISFDVPEGEVLGIIGRNGAGKSTLLKVLSRITEPTEGYAEIHGRVGSLLEVGTGFHPELTGRENIFLNGAILGMSRAAIKRKFDEIVAFAEVEQFLDTPVKRYSSGMRVRLAFAVAAHLEPEILIIDEVLAVGDTSFQKKCLGKMNDVASGGRTVLFVSHSMAAVESLCTRCILLEAGRIETIGTPGDVISEYISGASYSDAEVDLVDHSARKSTATQVFKKMRLTTADGTLTTTFPLDEDIRFEMHLSCPRQIQDAAVVLYIHSSLGQRVVALHSRQHVQDTIELDGERILACTMKSCRLSPGIYSVTAQVRTGLGMVDHVDSAVSFEVTARDIYGTGRLPQAINAVFLPDVSWDFDSNGSRSQRTSLARGIPTSEPTK